MKKIGIWVLLLSYTFNASASTTESAISCFVNEQRRLLPAEEMPFFRSMQQLRIITTRINAMKKAIDPMNIFDAAQLVSFEQEVQEITNNLARQRLPMRTEQVEEPVLANNRASKIFIGSRL